MLMEFSQKSEAKETIDNLTIDVSNHPHMEEGTHFIGLEKRISYTFTQTNELCYCEGH